MKAAIYARVSTDKQETLNQLLQLREYAAKQGWTVVTEYVEEKTASGKKRRSEFEAMMLAASQRKFDVLLFWALDRLSREGAARTLKHLEQLDEWKVTWHSFTQPFLDTTNELVRDILVSVLAVFAKQERIALSERTKAGLERARRQGKRLGRPIIQVPPLKLRKLVDSGLSTWEMSRQLGCSRTAVRNAVARLNQ